MGLPRLDPVMQEFARYLEWNKANPDQFSDAHFRERRKAGEIEALRYLGAPDWLVQAVPTARRARKWSPILAWVISVPFVIVFGLTYAFVAFLDPKAESKSKSPEA
jgi:hypothetical protein